MIRKPFPIVPTLLSLLVLASSLTWCGIRCQANPAPQATPGPSAAEIAQLEEKAQRSDPDALNKLAMAYLNGLGVGHDDSKAVELFRKAADLGYWKGQANLGAAYITGRGVTKDPAEALKWLRQAAGQGELTAQLNLAVLLDQGRDLPKDLKESVTWYEKAATQGSVVAAARLGRVYLTGEGGLSREPIAAAKWLKQAAEAGNAEAQNTYGLMEQEGTGMEKNPREAVEWFKRAAEQDNTSAQATLGSLLCFDGSPVPKDKVAAYKWLSLSAEKGSVLAVGILKRFKFELNAEQLKEGDREIAEFKARNQTAPSGAPQQP
jgi:hypothetical protein